MDVPSWLSALGVVAHWSIVVVLGVRLINKDKSPEVTTAWLVVLAAAPFLGAAFYLIVAEPWLSTDRARGIVSLTNRARARLRHHLTADEQAERQQPHLHPAVFGLRRLARETNAMPLVAADSIDILDDFGEIFPAMLDAVRHAQQSIDMLFFIIEPKGRVNDMLDELVAAAGRGVRVRILADAVGARAFLKSPHPQRLRDAGAEVVASLPVRWLRIYARRIDIRNHRKLLIVDGAVAFSGSFNLIDPDFFKRSHGVGPWVDVMARVTGPAAAALQTVFEIDHALELQDGAGWTHDDEHHPRNTGADDAADAHDLSPDPHERLSPTTPSDDAIKRLTALRASQPPAPDSDSLVQIVPTGPGQFSDTLHHLLLHAMHGASEQLILSSPYIMPDQSMMQALIAARRRGVRVVVIAPARIDGPLVGFATFGFLRDLHAQGVEVHLFTEGLLHSKTAVIDNSFCMLGTANMDRRSIWINFEVNLFIYNADVAKRTREVQQRYLDASVPYESSPQFRRAWPLRTLENTAELASPLM